MSAVSVKEKYDQLKQASLKDRYPSVELRRNRLTRLLRLLVDNQHEIAKAISDDFGFRSVTETQIIDIFPAIEEIKHTRRHFHKWMKVRKISVSLNFKPATARVMPQPRGVVGVVVPWNYPVFLMFGPICNALAAGNHVMVKPSEFTPAFSDLMVRLFAQHFEESEISVIDGGVDVAQAFTALPFDHLLFTGSTEVGKQVMRAAANNLTPVTLELGGKSPVIVSEHFSLNLATSRIITTKLTNAGQTCVAPDYVLLPLGKEQDFIQAAKREVRARYPNWPRQDYCSIVNDKQFQRLSALIADAEQKGAVVVKLIDAEDSERFMVPRIVLNANDDMRLMQEEIFGPLLPVKSYRAIADVIQYINERPRPLALYLFSEHEQEIEVVLRETHAGGVTLNDCLMHCAQSSLPFGGIGPSGMGVYHGEAGFETFSHLKPVFKQARINSTKLMYPPYGMIARVLLRLLNR